MMVFVVMMLFVEVIMPAFAATVMLVCGMRMVFVVMMLFVGVIMPVCGMMAVFVVMVLLKGVVVPAGTTAFFCMKKRLQPHSL